jgi:hypothetical protein
VPVTQHGAIFATGSKLLQRIYIPSFNDAEIDQQFVGPGESLLKIRSNVYTNGGVPAVQAAVGTPTFSGRCAVVDVTTKVIDHITADPILYTDPRGQLIPSDVSNVGDTWDGLQFTRSYLELDHITGKVAGTSVQPIATAAPKLNIRNYLIATSVAPSAVIGTTIPVITTRIIQLARG